MDRVSMGTVESGRAKQRAAARVGAEEQIWTYEIDHEVLVSCEDLHLEESELGVDVVELVHHRTQRVVLLQFTKVPQTRSEIDIS